MGIGTRNVRSIVWAAFAAIAGATSQSQAAVNLLQSPGFESGVSGTPDASGGDVATAGNPWSGWNNWVAPYSGFYTATVAHTGTQAAKTFSGANAGIYQTVAITAGDSYTASAWFMNSSTDALTGGAAQTFDVRLTFQDSAGNAIGDAVVSPGTLSGATAKDVWNQLSLTATAPAGASKVQFLAFLNNPNYAGGSMFVDDVSLTDVTGTPEPASLAVIGIGAIGLLTRRRK